MVLKGCETTVSTCTFKSSIILLESQSTYCSTQKVFESEWKKKIFKYRRNFTQAHMCTVLSILGFGLSIWMEMESTKIAFYCRIDHKSLRLILNIARKLSFNNSFEILKVYRLGTTRFRFESCMNVGTVLSQRNMGCLAYFKRLRPHIIIICKHTKILLLKPGEI